MILKGDIKFVTAAVMDDVPEGGGAPTGNVVEDGVSNEIFSDISELDRAGGNVSLRKIFVTVETNNTDTFLDANVIVAEPPTDPNVSVTLFSTKETFDVRDEAKQRVEAYLTEASEWPGFLLENHVAGQRNLQIFQRPTERMPNIGETIVLIYREGLTGELEQFVRVIDVSSVSRTYTNSDGKPYEAAVVSVGLSDALRYDFPGTAPNEFFSRNPDKSRIRETGVADAAVYCGVVRTVQPISIGDISSTVQSIFTRLVPSAQTEIPLVDMNAAGTSNAITQAGDGTVEYQATVPFSSETALSLGNPVTPGTLTIVIAGTTTLVDTGGQILDGATPVGVIDYARGTITFPSLTAPYTGVKVIRFKAAGAPLRVSDTGLVPVTPESRSFNYIVTVLPAPKPGAVMVSYRAQGRWYDLRDNGGGVLRGADSSYGVGTVSYASGTISVTLGVLPDVGSAIMFSWGTSVNYQDRSTMTVAPAAVAVVLPDAPLVPGSLTVTWDNGTPRTATDNGKGVISGSATGTVDYETGLVKFSPATLPLGSQEYAFDYDTAGPANVHTAGFPAPTRGGDTTLTLNLGQTNIKPGTVKLNYALQQPDLAVNVDGANGTQSHFEAPPRAYAVDDGNGNIVGELGRVAGTINYATGVINFQPDGNVTVYETRTRTWFGMQAGLMDSGGI